MKFFVPISMIAAVLLVIIALWGTGSASASAPVPEASPSVETAAPTETVPVDASVTLSVKTEAGVVQMRLDDYLFGVLAGEMPASFEAQALASQAVAARTETLYHMTQSRNHEDADVCTNAECCMAYLSDAALKEKWGEDTEKWTDKLRTAVSQTDGIVLTYDSTPALCAFHAASAGATEASSAVWGGTLPYLVSVSSPETAEDVPNYVSTVTVSHEEFRSVLLSAFPDAMFDGSPNTWISGITATESGRVEEMTVGGITVAGTKVRSLFSLRSAAFTVTVTETDFVFTVTGYGHGVGMSQYGANVMAKTGADWEEILAWYYPGTVQASLSDFL